MYDSKLEPFLTNELLWKVLIREQILEAALAALVSILLILIGYKAYKKLRDDHEETIGVLILFMCIIFVVLLSTQIVQIFNLEYYAAEALIELLN